MPLSYPSVVLMLSWSVIKCMIFGLLLWKQIVTFKGQNELVNIVKTSVNLSHEVQIKRNILLSRAANRSYINNER